MDLIHFARSPLSATACGIENLPPRQKINLLGVEGVRVNCQDCIARESAAEMLALLRFFVDMATTTPMHPTVYEARALLARIDGSAKP